MDIPCPSSFSFEAAKWPQWKQRFERFRIASDLSSKPQARQVAMLLYSMGERAEEVFNSFTFADTESNENYTHVLAKFDAHFVVKHNVIFERAKFNMRRQAPQETADAFIVALHTLAETCNFGDLRDQLIRDRIVVGILDARLSERLQLDADLTLAKAVAIVRQSELVHQQQGLLRTTSAPTQNDNPEINAVAQHRKSTARRQPRDYKAATPKPEVNQQPCKWCGKDPGHSRQQCPAQIKKVSCSNCFRVGHYAKVCLSKKRPSPAEKPVQAVTSANSLFLDTISMADDSNNTWYAEIHVNGKPVRFRIDTGADVTAIALETYRDLSDAPLKPAEHVLSGPNRATLDVVGCFTAQLQWRDACSSQLVYVLRVLHQPLLGRDAIEALNIVRRLDAVDTVFDPRVTFADRFTGLGCMHGEYDIKLKPDAEPFAVYTPRRVPINLHAPLKEELNQLEQAGVIMRVDEPTEWCAPIVVVPKRTGIRLCVDLSRLNESVQREQYSLPVIDQLLAQLAGATVFSKLDCTSSFHQILLSERSRLLTTFTTPFGRWAYRRLPYGICSASEVFQKRIHEVLSGAEGAACLVDDVLVYARTQAEHDDRLRTVLEHFRRANITLNDKCEFSVKEIRWAGHVISGTGIRPDPDRVKAVCNMPPPTNVSEVRCFLGMTNQLAKFASGLAELSTPIRDLLRKDRVWSWSSVQQKSFDDIKRAIASAPVLAHYDASRPTVVSADSSSYGLGAVLLQQQTDGSWRPVIYTSRSLTDVEGRYAQVEKECLALTWAAERLADYLIGIRFVLQTDHKPLVSLLSPRRALDDIPPRIQRMRIRLMRFDFSVEYLAGKQLCVADTLSRFPLQHEPEIVHSADVIERYVSVVVASLPITDVLIDKVLSASATDDAIPTVITMCTAGWPDDVDAVPPAVRPYWFSRDQLSVQGGLLLHGARVVVPSSLRRETLTALHADGHLGVDKCRAKARASIWWPKIGADIGRFVSSCQTCLHWARDRAEPLLSTPLPDLPWQQVATDLFELDGRHFIVVVDYYSRFFELTQLKSQTSDDVIKAMKNIFARHGIPMLCVSDGGPCYRSAEFQTFASTYGFQHRMSSPRFSQANGAAERAVQTAKSLLRRADDQFLALLAYRTTPIVDGYSPAQLLMGRQLRSTVPTTQQQLQPSTPDAAAVLRHDKVAKQRQATNYNRRHRARDGKGWRVGDNVWVPDVNIEATVTEVLPFRSYQLRTANGTVIRRNGRALRHALPPKTSTTQRAATPSRSSTATPTFNDRCRLRDRPVRQPRHRPTPVQSGSQSPVVVTRSGRQSRQPDRMNL
jgi:transposase InsO family protein